MSVVEHILLGSIINGSIRLSEEKVSPGGREISVHNLVAHRIPHPRPIFFTIYNGRHNSIPQYNRNWRISKNMELPF